MTFQQPDRHERLAATGPTAGLPKTAQRALTPRDDFNPTPKPEPNDWLANHPEPGQTFEQFLRSRPNQPDAHRDKLYLQPLGEFEQENNPSLDRLQRFATAFFTMDVDVLPALDLVEQPITTRQNPYTQRPQLLTGDILTLLRRRLPDDAFAMLGITMIDLYPEPSWNFVFGQASLRHRVGVYSFARYDPRFLGEVTPADRRTLLLRRSCKVLAHESAHMFGIRHCIFYHCLMNGSNHLTESDARPLHLCPVDLRKLHHSVGFDIVERYRHLHDFSEEVGFEDESQWLSQRLDYLLSDDAD
ncbi:MAG: archaemetzincin [Chloroflexota bacterium]|nr:archaemetzincin [Chloroflexota bacterium]